MEKQQNKPLEHPKPKSTEDAPLVPEVQRRISKRGSSYTEEADGMFRTNFHNNAKLQERPISSVYPVIDNDLARDNIENDLSDADLQSM